MTEHHQLSRAAIAALAAYVVVIAGVSLYVRRRAPGHPGTVIVEVLGLPVLILLVLIFSKRRRAHTGAR